MSAIRVTGRMLDAARLLEEELKAGGPSHLLAQAEVLRLQLEALKNGVDMVDALRRASLL